jgi:hypothetical protein
VSGRHSFFGDHDENQAGLIQEEVEMLAMIRDACRVPELGYRS